MKKQFETESEALAYVKRHGAFQKSPMSKHLTGNCGIRVLGAIDFLCSKHGWFYN